MSSPVRDVLAPVTIEQFASALKIPVSTLLDQLARAGMSGRSATDPLTDSDKTRLLDYLRKQHGAASSAEKAITLVRTRTLEIQEARSKHKPRTIQVEVRRKFVIVERQDTEGYNPASAAAMPPG